MPGLSAWTRWTKLTLSLGYTGGLYNEDETASLGGTLSYYPLRYYNTSVGWNYYTMSFENIFDNVTHAEKTTGKMFYRGFYLANFNGGKYAVPVYNISLSLDWIPAHIPPGGQASVYWGTDSSGIRTTSAEHMLGDHPDWQNYPATMSSISSETVAPTVVSWTTDDIQIESLSVGSWIPVWFKLSVSVGASAYRNAGFMVSYFGEATI